MCEAGSAQTILNPKAGFLIGQTDGSFESLDLDMKNGYTIGLDLRTKSRSWFFNPGLYYANRRLEMTTPVAEDDIRVHQLRAPIRVGRWLNRRESLTAFWARAGIVPAFNLGYGSSDEIDFDDSLINDFDLGAEVGLGLDVALMFSVDVWYQFGLTDVYDGLSPNNNYLGITLGLKFALGKVSAYPERYRDNY